MSATMPAAQLVDLTSIDGTDLAGGVDHWTRAVQADLT